MSENKNPTIETTADSLSLTATSSLSYNLSIALFALLTAVGIAFGLHAMVVGHEHVYGITREIPWGLLIATYVFFVVTSTGLCLVSSIGHVFGHKAFMPIAKRSVFLAIVTIVSGFLVIGFELANPWRLPIYNLLSPNLTSNIWWMGTLYGAYLFFMLLEFALLQMNKHKLAGFMGLMGVISGVAAHSNLGAVFGLLHAREFWYGPYMPIYFIASAMMSGCAAILFFTYTAYKANGWEMSKDMKESLIATGKLGALLICIALFFTSWKSIAGVTGDPPGKIEAMNALVNGKFAFNFWFFELFIGMVLPLVIILATGARNIPAMFLAGALSLIGIFVMRYDLVVVGQIVPHFHELNVVDYGQYLSYTPTLHEWMVTLAGFSLTALLFLLGEKFFKGHVSEAH